MTTYGYVRVSTGRQGQSGLGVEAQTALVKQAHPEAVIVVEIGSSRTGSDRPELAKILEDLDASGGTLVVAKLDRLARSTQDFASMLARAAKKGWTLVMLDLGVDTRTAAGKMIATIIAAVAEFERDMISERTSAALQAKKAKGERAGGKASKLLAQTQIVLCNYRSCGLSYTEIAEAMENYPSPTGKPWTKESVRAALKVVNCDG